MRIRAALLISAVAAALAAPLTATTHTVDAACHGTDRVVNTITQGGQTIYNDDRGFFSYADTPNEVDDNIPPGTRIPMISRSEGTDNSGWWVYLETNGHAGLQTGGDHAVLGETGEAAGFTDPCRAAHGASGFDSILF